ncbi:hypothetical protein RMATCC62417_17394 [Rhizopus microsporus]|nr:hypothetical protein RMATCC62417_17394 [Rhizopus microsporus]
MGYDTSGQERLTMETSSGQHHEDVRKTIDDSIKKVSSMISMMKALASSHMNASISTLAATRAFGLQAIKTTIVLPEARTDLQGKYHYNEVCTVVIPTSYDQRNKWLRVMELLPCLFIGLERQILNIKSLEDEQCGYINARPSDMIRNTII